MGIVLNLEQTAKDFGTVVVTDLTLSGKVRTQVKAKEYLETLGYSALFMEIERILELINSGNDSAINTRFPTIKNPNIRYTMRPSEYLELVNQRISSFSNTN